MRDHQIALQLYTVREAMAHDLPGTLAAVAGAGYRSVELAGLPPIDTAELAGLLDAAGLRAVAAHESLERLRAGEAAVAGRLNALGCSRVIVPSLPDGDRRTAADVRRVAAEIGTIGQRLGERGIRVGYHNHAFEFEPLDGTTVWDELLAALPDHVELEIDVYWASIGGRDPATLIGEAAGRVRLLHMKDRASGAKPHDEPPGAGTLDWPAIVAAARAAGVEWYVVEQDEPRDALADVERGRRYLAGLVAA